MFTQFRPMPLKQTSALGLPLLGTGPVPRGYHHERPETGPETGKNRCQFSSSRTAVAVLGGVLCLSAAAVRRGRRCCLSVHAAKSACDGSSPFGVEKVVWQCARFSTGNSGSVPARALGKVGVRPPVAYAPGSPSGAPGSPSGAPGSPSDHTLPSALGWQCSLTPWTTLQNRLAHV